MPMQETSLPVGATALKFTYNGRDYPILLDTDSFDRAGEDGDIPIIPLCRGCEFVGEVLPGEWKKGWGADISVFTARIDGGVLELGGLYDGTGADPDGWINSHHPIPLMDSTVVTVELESPTNDTDDAPGSGDNIKTEFYIRQDNAVNSPDDDDNYLSISIDVTAAGLLMEVIEEIGGAANTIFTGSTYDDASVRDDAAEQFTIWRIVFHDAVAGATAPEDVRHIHIYLKQAVDRAGLDTATENELTTSPYAIDDYLFDVGYPAYRIYTTDTGYFGDEVGSGHEAISTYLRVDYPSLFSLKYDFADADVGKGDVELWDGDPDVAASVQVFDEDHVFTHDPYIQNGLIRLHLDIGVTLGAKPYYYSGAAWVQGVNIIRYYMSTSAVYVSFPYLTRIVLVSPEKIVVDFRYQNSASEDDDIYMDIRATIRRGLPYIEFDPRTVYPLQQTDFEFYPTVGNFRFSTVGDVDAFGVCDEDLAENAVNTTMTDNWAIIFDDDGNAVLQYAFSNIKPDGTIKRYLADIAGFLYQDLAVADIDAVKHYFGAFPFSLVANLFKEAEDGVLVPARYFTDPTGASTFVRAQSSNGADNTQTLTIIGDTATGRQTDTIALNGVAWVNGSVDFTRVYILELDAVTAGNITVQGSDAGAVHIIPAGTTHEDNAAVLSNQNDQVQYNPIAVTALPAGRYLGVYRLRDTNQVGNDLRIQVQNGTTNSPRHEENADVFITLTNTYAYYTVVFDVFASDATDPIRHQILKATAGANDIYFDYYLLIPIGDGESWPQDLSHAAMRTFNKPKRLYVR